MKRCTTCNQTYTDDLSFCLSDGTVLAPIFDTEQQTVVRSSVSAPPTAPASSSPLKYVVFALILLLLAVVAGGAVIIWLLLPKAEIASVNNTAPNANLAIPPTSSPSASPARPTPDDLGDREAELERERKRLADERKKLEDEKRKRDDADPPPEITFRDPGAARIVFSRGSVGQTVSGTVGRARSYVLRTMAGQYLTATVNSSGGCVVFSGGGSSTAFTTNRGDTSLNIRNNCDTPQSYRLSVTVR